MNMIMNAMSSNFMIPKKLITKVYTKVTETHKIMVQ